MTWTRLAACRCESSWGGLEVPCRIIRSEHTPISDGLSWNSEQPLWRCPPGLLAGAFFAEAPRHLRHGLEQLQVLLAPFGQSLLDRRGGRPAQSTTDLCRCPGSRGFRPALDGWSVARNQRFRPALGEGCSGGCRFRSALDEERLGGPS